MQMMLTCTMASSRSHRSHNRCQHLRICFVVWDVYQCFFEDTTLADIRVLHDCTTLGLRGIASWSVFC